jgi:hypothetical protein
LALYLNIGTEEFQNTIVEYSIALKNERPLNLLPRPPIEDTDVDWNLLKTIANEFRNYPNEFHNGGSWSMVNGFYGLGLLSKEKKKNQEKFWKMLRMQLIIIVL